MIAKDLGFALLGCGRIAERHATLLGGGDIFGARLVAVCDTQADRADILAERFSVPAFDDMGRMMAGQGDAIDVIAILTESGNHAAHCLALAPYGKHLVVEKPIALKLDDADAMIEACRDNGIKLFVVKQNRFNLPVTKLRGAIDDGRFGKMVMSTVRVRWCRTQDYYDQDAWRGTLELDGGVLGNQASHHIDMLLWCMGDVESVFAMTDARLVDIESDDTAVVALRFKSGALGVIEATTGTRPVDLEGSISILGEGGAVEIGGFAMNEIKTWNFAKPQPGDEDVFSKFRENPPDVYGFGHRAYLTRVVEAIRDDTPFMVEGEEGRRSLELISAIGESVRSGREVKLS